MAEASRILGATLAELNLNPAENNFILAVSGGADSMAMAGLMQDWWQNSPKRQGRGRLEAVVIDHGIRDSSKDEAELTRERLLAMGIAGRIITITEPAPRTGIQEWARRMRYRHLWQEAVRINGVIITGHHADDQAEGVQMRLARGSGLRGLGGMKTCQSLQGVKLIRPCLKISGAALRQYGKNRQIPSLDDPSNQDTRFERVRVRQNKAALSEQGLTANHFNRLGAACRHLTDCLDDELGKMLGFDAGGWAYFDQGRFVALPPVAQIELLRRVACGLNTAAHPPKYEATERLAAWLKGASDGKKTLARLEWQVKSVKIWVFPEAECYPPPLTASEGSVIYDERWVVELPCKGRLNPLGEGRCAELRRRHPDVFKTGGVPVRAYWRWPVFTPNNIANKEKFGGLALENGAILPHLKERGFGLCMNWVSKFDVERRPEKMAL